MSESVILKSNPYGITLLLDFEIPFSELLEAIISKFRDSEKFFKNAKLVLAFEGRELSQEEQLKILEAIHENTSIRVLCILDQDISIADRMKEQLNAALESNQEDTKVIPQDDGNQSITALDPHPNTGQIYKGTLRSGQILESGNSMIILGDVNPGAKVISEGSIVVLGSLKGYAYAGRNGDQDAFVAALDMDPLQIKIADAMGRSSDRAVWSVKSRQKQIQPQVAQLINGAICINPITKGFQSENSRRKI